MHGNISDEEWDIYREAYQYLAEHIDPPAGQGAEDEAWWMAAAEEAAAVDRRWKGHRLMRLLLVAIYQYLGAKGKNRNEEFRIISHAE